MLTTFSFKKGLLKHAMEHMGYLYPGILKSVCIYSDSSDNMLQAIEYLPNKSDVLNYDLASIQINIERERKLHANYSWINPLQFRETPGSELAAQLHLNNEYKNTVLLLRLPNTHDKFKDLLFLFFGKNTGLFGLEKDTSDFSVREKELIGNLSFNYLRNMQNCFESDRLLYHKQNKSKEKSRNEIKELEQKNKNLQESYAQGLLAYCKFQLKEISENSCISFSFTEEALEKLAQFDGGFIHLKATLEEAAELALNAHQGSDEDGIFVEAEDIIFPESENILMQNSASSELLRRSDPNAKIRENLDKYELAALRVKEKGLPITGRNIGNFCNPPISHPAITELLYKYARKVVKLFNEEPEKWRTIRTDFKTIINLINKTSIPYTSPGNSKVG